MASSPSSGPIGYRMNCQGRDWCGSRLLTRDRGESLSGRLKAALFHPVIRRFLRDLHVMNVALTRAGRCNPNQLRLPLELGNRGAAAVPHPCAQAADELVNHRRKASLVRDTPFNAFRHQLVRRPPAFEIELVLEVPIAAAAAHRADGPHAAVLLVAAALEEDQL